MNRLAGREHLLDLVVAELPQLQTPLGRLEERLPVLRGRCQRVVPHQVPRARGEQQLLLRGQHLRAVDRQHRLALLDEVAGEVDEDLLNPAVDPRVDVRHARLVEGHLADRPDRSRLPAQFDGGELHADQLLPFGRDPDRAGRDGASRGSPCPLVPVAASSA